MFEKLTQPHTGLIYHPDNSLNAPLKMSKTIEEKYFDPAMTKQSDGEFQQDGQKKLNHPPKLFAANSVDSDPSGIQFDPTKGDAKLKQDNMEIQTKSLSSKGRHWDPKDQQNNWTEEKEAAAKIDKTRDVKNNLEQKLNKEPELAQSESKGIQSKKAQKTKKTGKTKKTLKKYEDEENTNLNRIKPQNISQGTPSNDIQRVTPFNKVSAGDYGKDSTATQNIYDNKAGQNEMIKNQKRDLNVINVLRNRDGSIIDLKSDPSKKTIIKNTDGTTSFNWDHIGTTWHYNQADVDVQTQERIREQTHTKPIKFNGVQHNAGSPTNPITKSANKLSQNTMGSGGHHEGLENGTPGQSKNSNLNVISKDSGVNTQTLNSPQFINLNGWTNQLNQLKSNNQKDGEGQALNNNGSNVQGMMAQNINQWNNFYKPKGCFSLNMDENCKCAKNKDENGCEKIHVCFWGQNPQNVSC